MSYTKYEEQKFWNKEQPQVYRTAYNVFRYYEQRKFLAVSKSDYLDFRTGETKVGKTVMIYLPDLTEEPEVLDALISILQGVKPAAPAQQG